MLFVCYPTILHKPCLQFLLGVKVAPRETENNNAYAKFWGDKQRALWYVMVLPEWSIGNPTRWIGLGFIIIIIIITIVIITWYIDIPTTIDSSMPKKEII